MSEKITLMVGLKLSEKGLESVRIAADRLAAAKRAVDEAASALESLCHGGLELRELAPCVGETPVIAMPGESVPILPSV